VWALSKGEHVDVNPGVEKRDFERAVADISGLPDQLIKDLDIQEYTDPEHDR
jgi:hypothetical protein